MEIAKSAVVCWKAPPEVGLIAIVTSLGTVIATTESTLRFAIVVTSSAETDAGISGKSSAVNSPTTARLAATPNVL